jgi:hypothetical protein
MTELRFALRRTESWARLNDYAMSRPRITAAGRAQTPSRPAGTQSMPLARMPKGRAFTAGSTAAGLIRSGEPSDPHRRNVHFQTVGF